jgi:hypothetical protein
MLPWQWVTLHLAHLEQSLLGMHAADLVDTSQLPFVDEKSAMSRRKITDRAIRVHQMHVSCLQLLGVTLHAAARHNHILILLPASSPFLCTSSAGLLMDQQQQQHCIQQQQLASQLPLPELWQPLLPTQILPVLAPQPGSEGLQSGTTEEHYHHQQPLLCIKRTYQPHPRRHKRKHGFLKRWVYRGA